MIMILKLSVSHFFKGDVPSLTSYLGNISQLIRFARASFVTDFNTRNFNVNLETSKTRLYV